MGEIKSKKVLQSRDKLQWSPEVNLPSGKIAMDFSLPPSLPSRDKLKWFPEVNLPLGQIAMDFPSLPPSLPHSLATSYSLTLRMLIPIPVLMSHIYFRFCSSWPLAWAIISEVRGWMYNLHYLYYISFRIFNNGFWNGIQILLLVWQQWVWPIFVLRGWQLWVLHSPLVLLMALNLTSFCPPLLMPLKQASICPYVFCMEIIQLAKWSWAKLNKTC